MIGNIRFVQFDSDQTKIKETTMIRNARFLFIVPVVMIFFSAFVCPDQAHAQSITIINNTPCTQWISISHDSGRFGKNLLPNAQAIKETNGTGIKDIKGGPTPSAEHCCFKKRVDIHPNLSGTTWRVEMRPDNLIVIDGDNGWTQVIDQPVNLDKCYSAGKTGSEGMSQKNQ